MKTLTKILFGVFIFTLSTSSSNPKGQNSNTVVLTNNSYKIVIDKHKLISKNKEIALSLDSLEKKCNKLIKLKKEVVSLRDTIKQ